MKILAAIIVVYAIMVVVLTGAWVVSLVLFLGALLLLATVRVGRFYLAELKDEIKALENNEQVS